jgi:hypothetical protein
MTRNQLANELTKKFSGDPMFTIDIAGKVQPTSPQLVERGGTVLIHADPASSAQYAGYVCAWRNGACHCADLVTDLNGEPHMKVRGSAFHVNGTTTPDVEYEIYTTPSENGGGPSPNATNGDLHVGH